MSKSLKERLRTISETPVSNRKKLMSSEVILPVISINGTAKHVLYEEYYEMLNKTDDLIEYMSKHGPNARDYGQANMELYKKAATQYKSYMAQLAALKTYLETIVEHVM